MFAPGEVRRTGRGRRRGRRDRRVEEVGEDAVDHGSTLGGGIGI